jgi:hypothetical protein
MATRMVSQSSIFLSENRHRLLLTATSTACCAVGYLIYRALTTAAAEQGGASEPGLGAKERLRFLARRWSGRFNIHTHQPGESPFQEAIGVLRELGVTLADRQDVRGAAAIEHAVRTHLSLAHARSPLRAPIQSSPSPSPLPPTSRWSFCRTCASMQWTQPVTPLASLSIF